MKLEFRCCVHYVFKKKLIEKNTVFNIKNLEVNDLK